MEKISLQINDLSEMKIFATKLADYFIKNPAIIFLDGDLGAGKTTFTQFFAKEIGVNDIVTSPTFNIFKRYQGLKTFLNHFDLYRIKENVYDQGFEEYWFSNEISIIEWSIYLPDEFKEMFNLKISIDIVDENIRKIELNGDNLVISYIKENCHEFIY
ncbi:tRNA threonylcarbamoyladenosine biosynthesis protein TsaE [Bacilli bacterium PM5-3]|nr:tRNA threonylcarbamoyladenosine biosynthesis protein TsaE [Bacilli bacterium PM5-3]MDH6602881.1 tRNA threonylcarbamoyladenosine biosynthesis protein TsaE [Bacilli bacterium PM5-9]